MELVLSLWTRHHHWDHERGDLIISTLPLGMFTSICSCSGTESDMIARGGTRSRNSQSP